MTGESPLAGARIITRRMDTVQSKPISWIWPGWLAGGKLHIVGGHPGDGKSTLTAHLAALFSRPDLRLPDGAPASMANWLFLLAEDALDDTLRPRLDAMGADPSKVFAIEAVLEDGQERLFDVRKHLPLLEEQIEEHGIGVVVIDPIASFMPGGDRNQEGEVRDALTPLNKLADRTGAAIIAIMHVGKSGSGQARRPLQQLLGSTAFGAIARVVWMVAPDPDDETEERRILGVVKSNIAPKPRPLIWSRPHDGAIEWHGETSRTMDELFGSGVGKPGRADAEAFLRDYLAGGMKLANEVIAEAKAMGISKKTLERAKKDAGVASWRDERSKTSPWYWTLQTLSFASKSERHTSGPQWPSDEVE